MNLSGTIARRDAVFATLATGPTLEPLGASTPMADEEIIAAARSMSLGDCGKGAAAARLVVDLLNPDIDLAMVSRRIDACPVITVRILRVANSAFYGCAGTIATVTRAAQVLGMTTLKSIAAAACLDHMVVAPTTTTIINLDEFRRHCVATACAAQALAHATAPALADNAFVAGLLHDLGLIVQWRLRPAGLTEWRRRAMAPDRDQHQPAGGGDLESRCTGTTHAYCARVLLTAWNLPPSLVEAVAGHDRPDGAPATADPLAMLVAAGDMLAADAGHALATEPVGYDRELRLSEFWSRHEELRIEVTAMLPDAVTRLCAVFGA